MVHKEKIEKEKIWNSEIPFISVCEYLYQCRYLAIYFDNNQIDQYLG